MTLATDSADIFADSYSPPDPPGGASPFSSGSSESRGSDGAANELVCPVCAQQFQVRAGLASHVRAKHPGTQLPGPAPVSPTGTPAAEQRPQGDGKRSRWGRKARTRRDEVGPPPGRPRARRVSTARFFTTLTTFAAGGVERVGQGPLAMIMGFTAPVAGTVLDEAVAGTVVDRAIQPFVRGSGKYENAGALLACWLSVAWASNNPENAEPAFALFSWSMEVILPLAGADMAERAKEKRKAAEQMAEVMPELVEILGPGDPIRNLWAAMWAQGAPPADEAAPADMPAA